MSRKGIPTKPNKTDLLPKRPDIVQASSDNLPFESETMKSIMFDPPFVIAGEHTRITTKAVASLLKDLKDTKILMN